MTDRHGARQERDRVAAEAAGTIPVGATEIAERLGVDRGTIAKWQQRGLLPAPAWTVGGRPAWSWDSVEAWARATGRAYFLDHPDERT